MKKHLFDRSAILLIVIAALFVAVTVFAVVAFTSDNSFARLDTDRPVTILFVFDSGGRPVSSQLLMFYPSKSKASLLDIPANTAVILRTVKRMDKIEYSYDRNQPGNYVTEISGYLDIPVNGYIVFAEKDLARLTDLLDGLQFFIPSMVMQEGEAPVRLPGGAVTLDGDKALQYLSYREESETDADALLRRQKLAVSLFKRLAEKSGYLADRKAADEITACMSSNLKKSARKTLFGEIAKLDADSMLLQKMTGVTRSVDGQEMFFPFYDGELARDMIRQTLQAMSAANIKSAAKRTYTVEILNGTTEKGLASRTAEIFESFGFDVVAVGNAASSENAKTSIIDRYGDKDALEAIGSVIKCRNFLDSSAYKGSIKADYSIILGGDFNGRVCVR